ncbi:uncharacterized protein BO66DRAFT_443961 [Aspergillus aculeatinus CBS 121060]|uniref:Uncharacterized protein n=1 Tax=Aspergillus aculeatinus CBS 121060 TaxID=1448322 RepID=A0ACD1GT66_9EURO|nr:hypothetical protein BO66DRAFT_443961 [Aspergillus aculeatinus CBS 121060]RAH64464.1 hypothetical protein BO66DRAFT_443961 [Aspergillus aculeatinus CBS 121060]
MHSQVATAVSEEGASSFEIPRPTIATWRLVVILLCIAIGLFLSLMDTTIVSTMLYTISDEFDGFKTCSWVVLAYTLSYVGKYLKPSAVRYGPCAFVPLVALLIVWPNDFHYARNVRFRHLDYLGALLVLLGSVLFVFILNEAAIRDYAWKSVPVILIFIISGLSWMALVYWQWLISSKPKLAHIRPQLPFRLLASRVMVAGFVSTILTGFVMLMVIVNIPLRAQIVNLKDAVASGILLLPLMGGTAVGSAMGGAASAKRNNAFWTLNLASVFMIIGSASLSTLTDSVDLVPRQWGLEAILGFGIGLSLSTMTFLTTMQVEFQDHAVAQGIVAQLRIFGGSIGIASGFIVFNTNVQQALAGVLTAEQLDEFYKTPAAIYKLPVAQQLAVRQVYVSTFNTEMRICTGVAAACLVATLCTYQRKPQSIKQRLADLEEVYARTEAARTGGRELDAA